MDPSLEPALRDLLARVFRSTLHRLRGLRALLGGWIECGVPPGSEGRVHLRLEEDMLLLARLDWLGSMMNHPLPLKRLEAGEAPAVLLAAALGLGTTEEAGARLPQVLDAEAAIALAFWLQTVAPDGVLDLDLHLQWQNRSLIIESSHRSAADLGAWRAAFSALVLECEPSRIAMRPGALQPAGAAAEAVQAQV